MLNFHQQLILLVHLSPHLYIGTASPIPTIHKIICYIAARRWPELWIPSTEILAVMVAGAMMTVISRWISVELCLCFAWLRSSCTLFLAQVTGTGAGGGHGGGACGGGR